MLGNLGILAATRRPPARLLQRLEGRNPGAAVSVIGTSAAGGSIVLPGRPLRGGGAALLSIFRVTRPLRLWPVLARLLVTVGAIILNAAWEAHCRHAERLMKEESQFETVQTVRMSRTEALNILGVDASLGPGWDAVPLTGAARSKADAYLARVLKEGDRHPPYLTGKVSGAYRVAVDAEWDQRAPPPPSGS